MGLVLDADTEAAADTRPVVVRRQCAAWRHAARTRHTRHVTASLRPARDTWHGPAGHTQVINTSTESSHTLVNLFEVCRKPLLHGMLDLMFDITFTDMYCIFIYFIFIEMISRKREDMNLVVVLQSCFPEIVNCEYQNCEDNIHPSISTVHEVLCLVLCRS